MTALLLQIYCWLTGFWFSLNDYVVRAFDGVLGAGDYMIGSIDASALQTPDFSSVSSYLWLAGATGLHICLGIIVGALILRFVLQSIPFVRWGS